MKFTEPINDGLTAIAKQLEINQNSLRNQLHELAQLVIGLVLLGAIGSYVVSGSGYCNNKNSKFCRDAQFIPSAIEGYFHNELPLPIDENINIDQSN